MTQYKTPTTGHSQIARNILVVAALICFWLIRSKISFGAGSLRTLLERH